MDTSRGDPVADPEKKRSNPRPECRGLAFPVRSRLPHHSARPQTRHALVGSECRADPDQGQLPNLGSKMVGKWWDFRNEQPTQTMNPRPNLLSERGSSFELGI